MEQLDILRHTVETLEGLEVPYLVVGSYASIAYGEARFTQGIDIVASLELKHVAGILAAFPPPEFYVSEQAVRDAVRTQFQFNIIHSASGNKVDIILPREGAWATARMARRRRARLLPDRDVMTAAPEDVIIGKLWYYSEGGGDRHLRDIAGILRVTGDGVDRLKWNGGRDNSATWMRGKQSSPRWMHPICRPVQVYPDHVARATFAAGV